MPRRASRARTLTGLADRMLTRAANLPELGSIAKRTTASKVLERLVLETPVDTSRALSNWQVGTGTAITQEIEPYFPGRYGSTEVASSREAILVGEAILRFAREGEPIVLSNVVDYIYGLAYLGYSSQATGDWVKRAMQHGVRMAHVTLRAKKVL